MASGQKASFVSPTYDFSSISSPKLYFRVSHALQASTDVDALKIYVSRDCGKTWTLRYSKSGSSLSTTTATGNYFIPASQSQWRQDMVNLTAYAGEPNVRLRFEYTGGGGNNIYIDDLNFNQPTGVGDLSEGVAALSVFPNPSADGAFAVSFNMNAAHPTVVKLVSAEGRETVLAQYARLEAGHQLLAFDTRALPSGYYTLWIQAGDEAYSRALIIKR